MKAITLYIFLLAMVCLQTRSYARKHYPRSIDSTDNPADTTDNDDAPPKKTRYIDLSLEYGSNFTYRHQIDQNPTQAPYIMPTLFYHDKSGLWASVGTYRLIAPYVETLADGKDTSLAPSFIETDFTLGWDFKIGKKNDFSFSYQFSKYDRQFPIVAQALANTFEGYYGHDFNLFYIGARGDYAYEDFTATINNKHQPLNVKDYFAMLELSREWFIDDAFVHDDEFDIDPMFTILAGTNNFIGEFITLRYPIGTKNGELAAHYAQIASKFLIQQFTLNIPVAYTIGNLTLTPSFEYTILTQKITETSPTSYPIYRFSAAYRFNFEKGKKTPHGAHS